MVGPMIRPIEKLSVIIEKPYKAKRAAHLKLTLNLVEKYVLFMCMNTIFNCVCSCQTLQRIMFAVLHKEYL